MKQVLFLFLVCVASTATGQKTAWNTELQSQYIDISGISTLKEPSQIITVKYTSKKFFIDGYHSFSWAEAGKTIQSYVGPGFIFANTSKNKSIAFKTDFAFNRVIDNASFIRPMVLAKWGVNDIHTFGFVGWHFWDTRRRTPEPVNGLTAYLNHILSFTPTRWKISNEIRIVYSSVYHIRNVIGVTENGKLIHNRSKVYVLGNAGYSFYASNGPREFIWNVGAGVSF